MKKNSTLEFIEFGHNRIRNKGLLALADGIKQNPNSQLKTLGLRFNFLTDDGVIEFLKALKEAPQLKSIFVKNNSINEFGLFQLKKVHDNLKSRIQLDLFEKLRHLD